MEKICNCHLTNSWLHAVNYSIMAHRHVIPTVNQSMSTLIHLYTCMCLLDLCLREFVFMSFCRVRNEPKWISKMCKIFSYDTLVRYWSALRSVYVRGGGEHTKVYTIWAAVNEQQIEIHNPRQQLTSTRCRSHTRPSNAGLLYLLGRLLLYLLTISVNDSKGLIKHT